MGGVAWNCAPVHMVRAVHTLSEVTVGAVLAYSAAVHARMAAHTLSEVVVAARDWYRLVPQVVSAVQMRLEVTVGVIASYSVTVHSETVPHSRLDVGEGGVVTYSVPAAQTVKAVHCLSEVKEGAAV